MSRTPNGTEAASRVRAARAYRDMKQADLAQRLDISLATMRRIENGERPMSTEDLIGVAEALEIPVAFMLRGMNACVPEPNYDLMVERLAAIERGLAHRISELERANASNAKPHNP